MSCAQQGQDNLVRRKLSGASLFLLEVVSTSVLSDSRVPRALRTLGAGSGQDLTECDTARKVIQKGLRRR